MGTDRRLPGPGGRARLAWGAVLLLLGLVVALFVYSFVGTLVLGLFVYYGVRPLHRRLRSRLSGRGRSAALTVLFVVVPLIGLVGYGALVAVRELTVVAGPAVVEALLSRLPGDPRSVVVLLRSPASLLQYLDSAARVRSYLLTGLGTLGRAGNALVHLTLSLALAFFLLRDGPRLREWFRRDVAGEAGVGEAYLDAVDADLETVYFGNVLTVLLVCGAALVVYHGFNHLSPAGLRLPVPTLLSLLTGLATFVPLVVGKLVYLPATAYLLWRATARGAGPELLPWVGAFLVVSFLVLDLVPQTFVRPLISGRSLHGGLVLFAYVLGTALFGWYGLFLGPLLLVLVVQAANLVLPEMLGGDPLTDETHTSLGSDPAGDPVDEGATGASDADGRSDADGESSD